MEMLKVYLLGKNIDMYSTCFPFCVDLKENILFK